VTEIPEHLLKRSQERRAAMGGAPEGGEAAATPSQAVAATAPSAPAAAAAPAAPAQKAEPVVVPEPPYVKAAKERHKIPAWAMATLSLLPIFMFMYWRGLTTEEKVVEGPVGNGEAIFAANCSSCHGASGEGGVGRQLNEGQVLLTFPSINDQMNFIGVGTAGFEAEGLPYYGDPDRPGGPHLRYNGAQMPAQAATLSQLEILEVACYIRYDLSGADAAGDYATEYEKWCSPEAPVFKGFEDGSYTFDTEELGIGTVARPMVGTPPINAS
jgi:mono/diheme cytochrome c family protein